MKTELCLPPAFRLVSCSAYSSTLKIEVICSSETSVDFQRTTWCYIPVDRTLEIKTYHYRIAKLNWSTYTKWPLVEVALEVKSKYFNTLLISGMETENSIGIRRQYVLPKRQWTSTRLQVVEPQKIALITFNLCTLYYVRKPTPICSSMVWLPRDAYQGSQCCINGRVTGQLAHTTFAQFEHQYVNVLDCFTVLSV
jgi:hypothetical protein